MAIITIQNLNDRVVRADDLSRPLLWHFQNDLLDWMHACGGKGRCTTCKLEIVNGVEKFLPMTEAEQRYARQGALLEGERLACQAVITGDVTVRVADEGKLPHMQYSDEG